MGGSEYRRTITTAPGPPRHRERHAAVSQPRTRPITDRGMTVPPRVDEVGKAVEQAGESEVE